MEKLQKVNIACFQSGVLVQNMHCGPISTDGFHVVTGFGKGHTIGLQIYPFSL